MSLHEAPIYLKKNTVQRIAVTATSSRTLIDSDLQGPGWVRIKAIDANVQVFLGGVSDTVDADETVDSENMGYDILAGQAEDFYMTSEDYIVWAADAAGFIVFMKTNKNVGK